MLLFLLCEREGKGVCVCVCICVCMCVLVWTCYHFCFVLGNFSSRGLSDPCRLCYLVRRSLFFFFKFFFVCLIYCGLSLPLFFLLLMIMGENLFS